MAFLGSLRTKASSLLKLFPILSFAIPLVSLYSLYPESFEFTWKGRAYYIIFMWLLSMDLILNWDAIKTLKRFNPIRSAMLLIAFLLPSLYVILANYYGLNDMILRFSESGGVFFSKWMPLTVEYLVFSTLFGLLIAVMYGGRDLLDFSIPMALLGLIGTFYLIDNLYPFGRFAPLQFLVPTTATLASYLLNFSGYQTRFIGSVEGTFVLQVWDPTGHSARALGVAWPCAGVDSLLVYTGVILLFFKKSSISIKLRIIYFAIGGVVTYLVNVLRVSTIFAIAVNGGDYTRFHDYYGPMYSVTWIASYMLIIAFTQWIWRRRIIKQKSYL